MLSAKCKMLAMPSRNDLMTTRRDRDYGIILLLLTQMSELAAAIRVGFSDALEASSFCVQTFMPAKPT
jgi:hypothetical protein